MSTICGLSLERLQVRESRRLAGTVEQQEECRPKMAEPLGHGHGLVGDDACSAGSPRPSW